MPITFEAGEPRELSFQLTPLPSAARLHGNVVDAENPYLGIEGALVYLLQDNIVKYQTEPSPPTGTYSIDNIEPGTYEGLVTAPKYEDATFEVTLSSEQELRMNPALSKTGIPDYLTMSKDELYSYLTNGAVAADWWSLSYDYRRQLGVKIIEWWSASIPNIGWGTKSNTKPDWDPWVDTHPEDFHIQCRGEAGIRYCILSGELDCPDNLWYYAGNKWYKQEYPTPFHLPVYAAVRKIGTSDSHTMCALQVGEDETQFNSWIFFQYEEVDIRPGESWQMPVGATVSVYEAEKIDSVGQLADYIRTLGSWTVV